MRRRYEKIILAKIDVIFKGCPLTNRQRGRLLAIGLQALFKCPAEFSWPSLTGLVVAGFGRKELFPALTHCSLHGIFDGTLHHRIDHNSRIGIDGDSLILPFAQTQMIYAFMEGVDPGYQDVIARETAKLIDGYPKKVIDRCDFLSPADRAKVIKKFAAFQSRVENEFIAELSNFRRSHFVDETLGLIAMVPKSELAILAESIVNLTPLRRKISLDSETVGGPVDVALISKGDGLIWIKRKHYFDPALNQQYFQTAYDTKE